MHLALWAIDPSSVMAAILRFKYHGATPQTIPRRGSSLLNRFPWNPRVNQKWCQECQPHRSAFIRFMIEFKPQLVQIYQCSLSLRTDKTRVQARATAPESCRLVCCLVGTWDEVYDHGHGISFARYEIHGSLAVDWPVPRGSPGLISSCTLEVPTLELGDGGDSPPLTWGTSKSLWLPAAGSPDESGVASFALSPFKTEFIHSLLCFETDKPFNVIVSVAPLELPNFIILIISPHVFVHTLLCKIMRIRFLKPSLLVPKAEDQIKHLFHVWRLTPTDLDVREQNGCHVLPLVI